MKRLCKYIGTMYRPSFIILCIGLAIFSISLTALAVSLRADILAEEYNAIYTYKVIIKELFIRSAIFFPVILLIDFNERKKKR